MAVTAITSWILDYHNRQGKEHDQTIWMLNVLTQAGPAALARSCCCRGQAAGEEQARHLGCLLLQLLGLELESTLKAT